jgi:hypothetical protein
MLTCLRGYIDEPSRDMRSHFDCTPKGFVLFGFVHCFGTLGENSVYRDSGPLPFSDNDADTTSPFPCIPVYMLSYNHTCRRALFQTSGS